MFMSKNPFVIMNNTKLSLLTGLSLHMVDHLQNVQMTLFAMILLWLYWVIYLEQCQFYFTLRKRFTHGPLYTTPMVQIFQVFSGLEFILCKYSLDLLSNSHLSLQLNKGIGLMRTHQHSWWLSGNDKAGTIVPHGKSGIAHPVRYTLVCCEKP